MTFLRHEPTVKNVLDALDASLDEYFEAGRPPGYKWTVKDYESRGKAKGKFPKTWIPVKKAKDAAMQATQMYPNIKWGFWGMDVDTINASMPRMISLLNQYPNVAAMTKMIGTPTSFTAQPGMLKGPQVGGIAMYSPQYRSILLHPNYYGEGKYESFKKACEDGAKSGFHPVGSGDVSSVLTHEFGHMISGYLHAQYNKNTLPPHTRAFLDAHYKNKGAGLGKPSETSGYSKTTQKGDYYEWFAESVVALHHTPRAQWSTHTKELAKALKGSGL